MSTGSNGHGEGHSVDRFMEEVEELKTYIVRVSEKCCCTCEFWRGLRAAGDDGFAYSLEDQEGVCKFASDSRYAMKYPVEVCDVWLFAAEFA